MGIRRKSKSKGTGTEVPSTLGARSEAAWAERAGARGGVRTSGGGPRADGQYLEALGRG